MEVLEDNKKWIQTLVSVGALKGVRCFTVPSGFSVLKWTNSSVCDRLMGMEVETSGLELLWSSRRTAGRGLETGKENEDREPKAVKSLLNIGNPKFYQDIETWNSF